MSSYLRVEVTGQGIINEAILAVHRELAEHDNYRGYSAQVSLSNAKVVRYSKGFLQDWKGAFVMRRGIYKFGRYHDIGLHSINKENIKKIIKEHL
jgi:hypothetical protein